MGKNLWGSCKTNKSKLIFTSVKNIPFLINLYKFFFHFRHRVLSKTLLNNYYLFANTRIDAVADSISLFGYYNVSPQNSDDKVIFLSLMEESPRISEKLHANVILKSQGKNTVIQKTRSFNWQQGCMLNWIDSKHFICNDFSIDTGKYVSKISDDSGDIIKTFDLPIYSIDKINKRALCLSFERLSRNRPDYGYFNHKVEKLPELENDGIWSLDLKTGDNEFLISIRQLINFNREDSFDKSEHWVNHIEFRPSGKGFVFFHRWKFQNRRFTRFFYYDFNTKVLELLPGFEIVSHYCWMGEDEILVFCRIGEKVGYHLINIETKKVRFFSEKFLNQDGHPSLSPDGKLIVVDTYPGKDRFSKLFLFDLGGQNLSLIGKFYQPIRYQKEFRVDLHPKWSPDGKSIYFESGHLGKRQLFKIEFSNLK